MSRRMKSQCLLYLILKQKSNALWVVQPRDVGFVIMLVKTVSRKPTSMTKEEKLCHPTRSLMRKLR